MLQEYIEIRGARENNLKNVNLKIPKRKITISGNGTFVHMQLFKKSLVSVE